jgi:competence protein ComEA
VPSGGAVGKALALGATLAFVTLVGLRAGPAASRPAPAALASTLAPEAPPEPAPVSVVAPSVVAPADAAMAKPQRSPDAGRTPAQNDERAPEPGGATTQKGERAPEPEGATTQKGERAPEAAGAAPSVAGILPDGRVVLNVASEQELTQLPGVGPARAKAIFALRSRLGRFRSLNDLRRVKGIGRRSLERLRSHAVLDPPA